MSWWGKLIGGGAGFMLGGPLGALIGAALGHTIDASLKRAALEDFGGGLHEQAMAQTAFFTATFSVMGAVAKADGRVTPDEIRLATSTMDRMSLSADLKRVARRLFTEGKAPQFPLDDVLQQLRAECRQDRNLLRMFVLIQLQAAYADGVVHPDERQLLETICDRLALPRSDLKQLDAMLRAELYRRAGARPDTARFSLDDAYSVLNVRREASDDQVKRAYRRLMSQNHPDKLVARGLPEEMMQVATEKTQEIQAAYEAVMEARRS